MSSVQSVGEVLKPSPYLNYAYQPPAAPPEQHHKTGFHLSVPHRKNGYQRIDADPEATKFGRGTGTQGMVLAVPQEEEEEEDDHDGKKHDDDDKDEVELQPVAGSDSNTAKFDPFS